MYDIGRLCVKIAGRDAGKKCVIVDVIDQNYVLVDGQTRRKKCNIAHLEPLDKVIKIKKNASNKDIVSALKKEGIECREKAAKEKREKTKRPRKLKKKKAKPEQKKEKKSQKKDKGEKKETKESKEEKKEIKKGKEEKKEPTIKEQFGM